MKPAFRRKRLRTDSTTITESKALHAVSALPDIIDSAAPSPASIIEDSRDSIPESKEPLQADIAKNIPTAGQGLVANEPVQEAIPENQPLVPIEPAQAEHDVSEPSKSEEALVPQIEQEAQDEQAEPTTKRKARAAANRAPQRRSLPRRGQAKAAETVEETEKKEELAAKGKEQEKDYVNEIEEMEEVNVRSVRKSTRKGSQKVDVETSAKRSRRSTRGKKSDVEEAENLDVDEDSVPMDLLADMHPVPESQDSKEKAKSGDKIEIEPDDVSGASGISSEKVSSIPSSDSMPELNAICAPSEQDSTGTRSVPELTPERELLDSAQKTNDARDSPLVEEGKTKTNADEEFSVLATWNVTSEDGDTENEAENEVDVASDENKVAGKIEKEKVDEEKVEGDNARENDKVPQVTDIESAAADKVHSEIPEMENSQTLLDKKQKPETSLVNTTLDETQKTESKVVTKKAEMKAPDATSSGTKQFTVAELIEHALRSGSPGPTETMKTNPALFATSVPQKETSKKEGKVDLGHGQQIQQTFSQTSVQPVPGPVLQDKPSIIGQPSQYEDISDAEDIAPTETQEKPADNLKQNVPADPNMARKSPFVPLEDMAKYEVEIIREEDIQKSGSGIPQEKGKKSKSKKQIDLPAGVEEILNEYSEAISQTKPGGSKEGSISGGSVGAPRRDSPAFGALSGAGSRRSSVDSAAGSGENVELANMLLMLSQQSNSSGSDRLDHNQYVIQGAKLLAFRDTQKHCRKANFFYMAFQACKNQGLRQPKVRQGFPIPFGKPERFLESHFFGVAFQMKTQKFQ